jgi:hypothetical protein
MHGLWLPWTSYLSLVVEIALILNLIRNGLYRVYKWFFAYLAVDAVETVVGSVFQAELTVFGCIYVAGQTLKLILAVFVVLEFYRLALERHPALSSFGRATVSYALAAAALIAGLSISFNGPPPGKGQVILYRFFTFERIMNVWMLAFVLMIGLFLSWFPVVLKRNGALYIAGFAIYFLARSAALLVVNLTPQWRARISDAMLVTTITCMLVWLFALTRRGEQVTTIVGHRWRPSEVARLTGQLDAINAKLLRLSRR